jgi:hypothetical protein
MTLTLVRKHEEVVSAILYLQAAIALALACGRHEQTLRYRQRIDVTITKLKKYRSVNSK